MSSSDSIDFYLESDEMPETNATEDDLVIDSDSSEDKSIIDILKTKNNFPSFKPELEHDTKSFAKEDELVDTTKSFTKKDESVDTTNEQGLVTLECDEKFPTEFILDVMDYMNKDPVDQKYVPARITQRRNAFD